LHGFEPRSRGRGPAAGTGLAEAIAVASAVALEVGVGVAGGAPDPPHPTASKTATTTTRDPITRVCTHLKRDSPPLSSRAIDRSFAGRRGGDAAGLMAVAAIVEIVFGVDAEQRSLEDIAEPLSAQEAT